MVCIERKQFFSTSTLENILKRLEAKILKIFKIGFQPSSKGKFCLKKIFTSFKTFLQKNILTILCVYKKVLKKVKKRLYFFVNVP